jgi:alkylation response protein AidB-like acyl-CoA dehydrogenase
MRAERDGDHYIVTGTKTWTTQAQDADWMFCLVRSGPGANPREGISFLLVDLASPGIRVCPIELLDHRPHVNEVHFDRVRVPVAQRIGAEGQGWACSNVVLAFERLQIAEVPQSRRLLARLIALSRGIAAGDGTPMIEQPAWRQRLADAAAQLAAHAAMHQCILRSSAGREPGPEVSMLKLRGAELRQLLNELIIELLGTAALDSGAAGSRRGAAHEGLVHEFLYSRASTVYGGSNEIQRNLIARRVLGLG